MILLEYRDKDTNDINCICSLSSFVEENNLYKSITKNGYTDFPNINARVLYYEDDGIEYAITINLNNLNNVIEIEQFE